MPLTFSDLQYLFLDNLRPLWIGIIGHQLIIYFLDLIIPRTRSSIPVRLFLAFRITFFMMWDSLLSLQETGAGAAVPLSEQAMSLNAGHISRLQFSSLNFWAAIFIYLLIIWTYHESDRIKAILGIQVGEVLVAVTSLAGLIPLNFLEGRPDLSAMKGDFLLPDVLMILIFPALFIGLLQALKRVIAFLREWKPKRRIVFWLWTVFYVAISQASLFSETVENMDKIGFYSFGIYQWISLGLVAIFIGYYCYGLWEVRGKGKTYHTLVSSYASAENMVTGNVSEKDRISYRWCGDWRVDAILKGISREADLQHIDFEGNLLGYAPGAINGEDIAILFHFLVRPLLKDGDKGSALKRVSKIFLHCAAAGELLVIRMETNGDSHPVPLKECRPVIRKYHGTAVTKTSADGSSTTIILNRA